MYYDDGKVRVRKSTKEDAEYIAEHMRECDKNEIWASHHKTPLEGMKDGINNSIFACTVENGHPIAMFGICPVDILGDTASVWMLATDDMDKIKKRFVKNSRKFIEMMLEYYPKLENYVSANNLQSIKWLKNLGAVIEEAKPYGADQELFHHFYFERKN